MKLATVRSSLLHQKNDTLTAGKWFEVILITLLPICVGFYFKPADPFFLETRFPILLLPPFLLAIRYGHSFGMVSFAITTLLLTSGFFFRIGNMIEFPGQLLFGILIITLIAGEMTSNSLQVIKHNQLENKFLTMRFSEFTNTYHIMKVSHDQLKEQLANSKISLREAMQMVRDELKEQHRKGKKGLSLEISQGLLSIFNYFCSTQIAGVFAIDKTGSIIKQPVATQGIMSSVRDDDLLICQALDRETMVSVKSEIFTSQIKANLSTDLLAVIPIKDISGHLWGIVAISEMHFSAFQEENLNLMQLIGAYTGDLLSQAENIFYNEDDRQAFFDELSNCWRMANELGIISSIIRIYFKGAIPITEYFSAIVDRKRGLDQAWLFNDEKNCPVIYLLIPLMSTDEFNSYRLSLNGFLREQFGQQLDEIEGVFQHLEINGKRPLLDYVSFVNDWPNNVPETVSTSTSLPFQKLQPLATNTYLKDKENLNLGVLGPVTYCQDSFVDGHHLVDRYTQR